MMRNVTVINSGMQRATAVRFKLRLPVIFRWSQGGDQVEGGFTKYISLHAAWVITEQCPPTGSHVHLEVLIPSPDETAMPFRMVCIGDVVRVFSEDGNTGFLFHGTFDDEQMVLDADHSNQSTQSDNELRIGLQRAEEESNDG